jgi:hypothetical protein
MKVEQMVRISCINEITGESETEFVEMELEMLPSWEMFLIHELALDTSKIGLLGEVENIAWEYCINSEEHGEEYWNNLCDKHADLERAFAAEQKDVEIKEPTMTNEAAHLILEMEKEIEAELKPFVAPDMVKLFAIKAAINGDRLVRAIKENEPWTDEDSLVSSGVLIRNNHTDATLYLSETYILEYLDKVSGKIFVISDLFYRGHYKDFLLFNKRGSYWVLMADQVKKVVQQDKFVGGAF